MGSLNLPVLEQHVETNVRQFHKTRLAALQSLKLDQLLKRKNPYLFRSKNLVTAGEFIKYLVDDHLSSAGETQFGNFLEELAIHVSEQVDGGRKSAVKGIDLEFDRDGERHVVAIKSGPNWGNSSQIAKMRQDFIRAAQTLRTSNSRLKIKAINGCCYGRDERPDKGDYHKLCGQQFWAYISLRSSLYLDLIKPLAHEAEKQSTLFRETYASKVNLFTVDFGQRFCSKGPIDWQALVRFNSGAKGST